MYQENHKEMQEILENYKHILSKVSYTFIISKYVIYMCKCIKTKEVVY